VRLRVRVRVRPVPAGVAVLAVCLLVAAGVYVHRTQRALDRLTDEVRADCAFKRDMAEIWHATPTSPGPITLTISWDAYDAYEAKGCAQALGAFTPPTRPRPPASR
jgi:hypothetical protein